MVVDGSHHQSRCSPLNTVGILLNRRHRMERGAMDGANTVGTVSDTLEEAELSEMEEGEQAWEVLYIHTLHDYES